MVRVDDTQDGENIARRQERPLRRLLRYARPFRRRIRIASFCSILNKVFDLAPPVLIGMAVDVVVREQNSWIANWGFPTVREQLIVLSVLSFVIWLLESASEYAYDRLWRNLAQALQHDLRLDAYGHLQRLDLDFFENQSTGDLLAVLNDDVNQLERFLDQGCPTSCCKSRPRWWWSVRPFLSSRAERRRLGDAADALRGGGLALVPTAVGAALRPSPRARQRAQLTLRQQSGWHHDNQSVHRGRVRTGASAGRERRLSDCKPAGRSSCLPPSRR